MTEPVDIAMRLLKGSNDPPYDPDNPYWQDPNWKNYVDPDPLGAFGIPQSTWDEIAAGQEEEGNKVQTPQEIAMEVFNERTENVYDSPDTHCQLHGERLQPIVDPQSIRQFPKGADENMYCTACEQNITNEPRQPQQFDIDEDTRRKLTGEPMDLAMRLLKAPYDIEGEVFDRLYQGGREGDPDSGYWPPHHREALVYSLMGSDQNRGMRADGVPQIRVAPETDEMHYLNSDPETAMVGMVNPNTIPHEIQSREETARDIEELLSNLRQPWAEPEHDIDHPHNEMQSDIAPFMDTGARDVSNKKRIAHIEEMLNRVRTGEPMDIAMQLLKYQTNLGEHHEDFPSPYGPVVAYHGTTGDNFTDMMAGPGLLNPDPNYRHITTAPSEAATYALQRSGGNHGVVDWQSQPKLVGIRQAAFDQNHPNYIGPSHGLKNADDYAGAEHFGGNIPRQFLTNTPMTNQILGDTMQAREGRQDIISRNMSYPAQSQDRIRRINEEKQNEVSTQAPMVNQRGEVRPTLPSQNQLSRAKWSRSGQTAEQMMNDYNQQMTQYMQPNPVVQPTDPNQQQLPLQQPQVQQPQVQQPQVQQPQMIQQGEPMDLAMRLLKAKSKGQESLTEWTKEKWEFVGDDKKEMKKPRHKRGRYAPKSVADSMSPSQKATENKTKRAAHKKGKQHAPRGKSVKPMYRSVEGKK